MKKAIKEYLNGVGAFWSMIPGGAYAKTGDPDMIVCYMGRYIAVEAKTPEGVQSQWQKLRQSQIEEAGGIYVLARSVEQVKEVIENVKREEERQDIDRCGCAERFRDRVTR